MPRQESCVKINVRAEACVGHGMCRLAAPEIFELSEEDGHAIVLLEDVPAHLVDMARHAERGCPEGAIRIVGQS